MRSYLSISQLLPLRVSKAKYVRENAAVGTSCTHWRYYGVLYSRYCEFDRLCTMSTNSQAYCSAQNSPRWSHEWESKQITYARDNSSTQCTGSILRYCELRGIVFRYRGYMLACALGVRYCSYLHYSQYVGLLSTRNILAGINSTPILSVLGLRLVLEHSSVKPLCCPQHQEPFILGGYILYLLYLPEPVTK